MDDVTDKFTHVTGKTIEDFISRALVAMKFPENDARTVAELMAEADLSGVDTHGIFRLPQYFPRIRDGGINVQPNIHIAQESDGTAVVDGDNGMGHLVVKFATELAIKKGKEHGIGWVGIFNGNHAGPAGLYPKMCLKHDMIGIYAAIGSANHLPPWGGTESLLSTNPIAAAVPAMEMPPVVLDMATTVAAYGKIKEKAQRNEPMPEGWMMGPDGQPLTDASRAEEGYLLPIGGYKGFGLAVILGFLAGTLNGAAFGKRVIDFTKDTSSVTNTGQFICAIDIAAFGDVDAFKRQVDVVVREMKASPTLPGFDEVRLPGESSYKKRAEREVSGVPIHQNLMASLDKLADELGIDKLA